MIYKNPTQKMPLILTLSGSLLFSTLTIAQESEVSFSTQKVTDSIYMLSGVGGFTGGNVGLTVGPDGVAMIDNGVPDVLGILKNEIAEITDQPIDYLINTHVHGDHIGNNHDFGVDGARIVSHENLRASLVKTGVRKGDSFVPASKETLPVLTFSDQITIHINNDAAKVIHFAAAHTDGDAIVYFQNDNVIHTGDLMFNGLFPYIDADNGGNLSGVIAALKGIADLANTNTKIIPGHGALAAKSDVLDTIAMLEDSKSMVEKLVAEGKTDAEILEANPLEKYQQYHWSFITTERMTQQVLLDARN